MAQKFDSQNKQSKTHNPEAFARLTKSIKANSKDNFENYLARLDATSEKYAKQRKDFQYSTGKELDKKYGLGEPKESLPKINMNSKKSQKPTVNPGDLEQYNKLQEEYNQSATKIAELKKEISGIQKKFDKYTKAKRYIVDKIDHEKFGPNRLKMEDPYKIRRKINEKASRLGVNTNKNPVFDIEDVNKVLEDTASSKSKFKDEYRDEIKYLKDDLERSYDSISTSNSIRLDSAQDPERNVLFNAHVLRGELGKLQRELIKEEGQQQIIERKIKYFSHKIEDQQNGKTTLSSEAQAFMDKQNTYRFGRNFSHKSQSQIVDKTEIQPIHSHQSVLSEEAKSYTKKDTFHTDKHSTQKNNQTLPRLK